MAVALTHWFTQEEVVTLHKNYCENLYFQPDSLKKMQAIECDIQATEKEIARVQSGRY